MSDDEDVEKFWSEKRKLARDLGYFDQPDEDLLKLEAIQQAKSDLANSKFPESDGSELAELKANQDISVIYSSNIDGSHAVSTHTYAPDNPNYQRIKDRHKMHQPRGQMHRIWKKWDLAGADWQDLGDEWL